jgi:hypothetical protein
MSRSSLSCLVPDLTYRRWPHVRRAVTAYLICTVIAQPCIGQPAAPPASAAPTQDAGWPRQITKNGATLVYYQPQLDEWKDYKDLRARAAFSLTPSGGKPVLGVASFEADTIIDKKARTVFLRDIDVKSVRFPTVDPEELEPMEKLFKSLVPKGGEPIALDRLTAEFEKDKVPAHSVAVKNDPPPIFYSTKPAILLLVDGEPALNPIENTDLASVVNANWDLFVEKSTNRYFLMVSNGWLTAGDLKGPWEPTLTLPKDMAKLPPNQNWDPVKKMVPPPPPSGNVPLVFYSKVPAELILVRGEPVYSTIPKTSLLYITNTDEDVFLHNAERQFYLLLSGRWFRSAALDGPWTYAGDKLPPDFAKIPSSSPKARVLASVPGTQEAADAVMLAQIPTTAIVNKAEAEAKAKVTYDGDPQFKPIEQTSLQYATNTQEKVIQVGDLYYLCFQGVWFVSTSPKGPWKTADSVPKEIYTIPPSSPVYNVTYVTQANPTDTTVESSTTAGYFGMFVVGMAVGAAVCYGTGYYYPPYYGYPMGYGYPIYRPWPATYGAGAYYNPRTGAYGWGRSAYGPYGGAGGSAWYNPSTGRYGRSATVQGPYGGRTAAASYNPWTGGYTRTSQGHNAYSQWGSSVSTRGNQWAQTGHVSTARGTTAGYRTSAGTSGVVSTGANGTVTRTGNGVYAGNDGNVYRRNSGGDWSQYNNGSWNSVDRPTAQSQGLENSAASRQRGEQQVQRQRSSSAGSAGGARSGGRAGGGRRR